MEDSTTNRNGNGTPLDVEHAVRERYSQGAKERVEALCCPTNYDAKFLAAIPAEVLERDYGCGDPSKHLHAGETVLDLGSGGGKICFIASQVVGPEGRILGVDMNDDMLALARRAAPAVAERVGHGNVTFHKARIQDLAIDRERVDAYLREHPVRGEADWTRLESFVAELRAREPLIADGSVDAVVSNCVLNLVASADKKKLFKEIFRVLKRGGRAVISDIVSDEEVPAHLQADPELWSGCISGALREDDFLRAFEEAGFYGISLVERDGDPWRTVEGIEFRSVTVIAYKGKEGACWDQKHALIYKGPWKRVEDDDGHVFERGVRTAVCEKTFHIYRKPPYRDLVEPVCPREEIPLAEARPFPCTGTPLVRDPKETKGEGYHATTEARPSSCGPSGSCC